MTAETAVKETEKQEEIPREYVEMTFVKETATGRGRNEIFIMENMHNGTMKITEGRIGITVGRYKPKVTFRPISDWDNVYQFRIGRGYMATKTKKNGEGGSKERSFRKQQRLRSNRRPKS